MKNLLKGLNTKLWNWMYGRYGMDELYKVLSAISCVLLLLSCIPSLQFLWGVALVLMIWATMRCLSKNLEKRRAERECYLQIVNGIRGEFDLRKRMWKDRKTHRYYKCPNCKTAMRVPKNAGKIRIACPRCRKEIIKKT